MATNLDGFESVVDYNTVLDDFEGPLDLLLHLINIAQIRIEDVFVSKVTEQFLDYIEYMKTQPCRDVDKESEYKVEKSGASRRNGRRRRQRG